VAAYLMVAFAVLGLLDVIINDILPESYSLARALHDRHLVSMGLSLCFGVEVFTEVKYNLSYAALPFFIIYAVLIPATAFVDVVKRYKTEETPA
jgi:hypothetical protein